MAVIDDYDILSMRIPQPEPKCGSLRIAEPMLFDGCFSRSTVCIIDHSADEGTMGLITNRNSGYLLHEIVDGIEENNEIPVFVGGPVHNERLYYLHTLGSVVPDSVEVIDGLYVGGDFECIREIINMGAIVEGNIRFFVGYSGWEKGQLRKELDNFEWAVGQSIVADVLNLRENDAWRKAVKDMGARYKVWLNVPLDAQLN